MQADQLLFPGYTGPFERIRRDIAFAISKLESAKGLGAPDKPAFANFLADAAAKTPGYAGPVLPATQVVLSHGQNVPIKNSAGVAVPGSANAVVAGGALSSVNLPATVAAVTSGLSTVAATGTGTKVTFTVANGVITGIALSA